MDNAGPNKVYLDSGHHQAPHNTVVHVSKNGKHYYIPGYSHPDTDTPPPQPHGYATGGTLTHPSGPAHPISYVSDKQSDNPFVGVDLPHQIHYASASAWHHAGWKPQPPPSTTASTTASVPSAVTPSPSSLVLPHPQGWGLGQKIKSPNSTHPLTITGKQGQGPTAKLTVKSDGPGAYETVHTLSELQNYGFQPVDPKPEQSSAATADWSKLVGGKATSPSGTPLEIVSVGAGHDPLIGLKHQSGAVFHNPMSDFHSQGWTLQPKTEASSPPAPATPSPASTTAQSTKPLSFHAPTYPFPASFDDFTAPIQSLGGGGGGAHLVKDKHTDAKYVLKRGVTPQHIENELAADKAYRALGIPVAPSRRYIDSHGNPVKVSQFIEGQSLEHLLAHGTPDQIERARQRMSRSFATHALFANWDATGPHNDNVIFDHDGRPRYIDAGGALEFHGVGSHNPHKLSDHVPELTTLKDSHTSPMHWIFSDLTPDQVKQQVQHISDRELPLLAAIPKHLRTKIATRLSDMRNQVGIPEPPGFKGHE